MISLERFNKQKHKYIYHIRKCKELGYAISGYSGTVFYMMYPLKEAIKMYNTAAAQSIAAEQKLNKRG